VPDITLTDYDGCRIAYEELQLVKEIGVGGYASVFYGTWHGEAVAVKKLKVADASEEYIDDEDHIENTFSKTFNEFRREIVVMRYQLL
jgi:hypothetical protein